MADTNQPIPVIVTIKKIVKLARKKKKTKQQILYTAEVR